MAEVLGALVARLREERGLTQRQLANRATCDPETIARVEQGRGRWNRRTARAVYFALRKAQKISPQDAIAYLKGTGLVSQDAEGIPDHLAPASSPADSRSQSRETAHEFLDRLLDRHGAQQVLTLLRAVLTMSRHAAQHPPPALRVVAKADASPPQRRLVSQHEGVTDHGVPYVDERYYYLPADARSPAPDRPNTQGERSAG